MSYYLPVVWVHCDLYQISIALGLDPQCVAMKCYLGSNFIALPIRDLLLKCRQPSPIYYLPTSNAVGGYILGSYL